MLNASEELYRNLLEATPDALVIVDRAGVIETINTQTETLFGHERDELVGRPMEMLVPERFCSLHRKHRQAYAGEPYARPMGAGRDLYGLRRDGIEFPVDISLSSLQTVQGLRFMATIRDITERKESEQALRASEERFSTAFHDNPVPVSISRIQDGRLIDVNAAFLNLLGYRKEEVIGHTSIELGLVVDSAVRGEVVEAIREHGTVRDFVTRARKATGEILDVMATVTEIELDGKPCLLITIIDITNRKKADEALRASDERFRVSLMHSPVVVFNQDLDLRYTWVYNPIAGISAEDVIGKTDADLVPPEDAARAVSLRRQVLSTGVGKRIETQICVAGHTIHQDLTIEPLRDETGKIIGLTGASFDITDRKQAEEAFRHAKEELEGKVGRSLEEGNVYQLSFREFTVLHLVAEGKTDKEIGAALGISPATVSKHVGHILSKMDAESRTAAGARAIREGLVA